MFIFPLTKLEILPSFIKDFIHIPAEGNTAELTDELVTKIYHMYAGLLCMLHCFRFRPILFFTFLKFDGI